MTGDAKPLTREEREEFKDYALDKRAPSIKHVEEWWAGYEALEARIEALRAALENYAGQSAARAAKDWDRAQGFGAIARSALAADDAERGVG